MDPVSQAVVGAVAAQVGFGRRLGRMAVACGAVGGVLADADVLIRSATDPLIAMEYHRHFTHALAFVPIGGVLAALPFLLLRGARRQFPWVLAATTLGYATHGPLDALTSYGTLLLWPFSHERVALDWISIVDPLFTLPLLALLLAAVVLRRARPAQIAAVWLLSYLALGGWQHHRAEQLHASLVASRGHAAERSRVLPTLGNLVLYRSLYLHDGRIVADALRVPPFGQPAVVSGRSVALAPAPELAREARDFRRFAWFADDWVAEVPGRPGLLGDMRYSADTDGFAPLWAVHVSPGRTVWIDLTATARDRSLGELWALLSGRSPRLESWCGGA